MKTVLFALAMIMTSLPVLAAEGSACAPGEFRTCGYSGGTCLPHSYICSPTVWRCDCLSDPNHDHAPTCFDLAGRTECEADSSCRWSTNDDDAGPHPGCTPRAAL